MQAEQTRAAVLEAARSLFADLGWVGTSMRGVAREAGVAVETVYAGFRSKRDLLLAAVDVAVVGDDLPIPLAQRDFSVGLGVGTRRERVAKAARMSAAISSRTCALNQALIQGAATDIDLARCLADVDERRRGEITSYFEQVASRPATPGQIDEVWLLTSADVFHMLVHRSAWTPEHYEQWLVDRLTEITSDGPHGASGQSKNAR
ncbi:MAG: helix-turn-helix domain-containing protein [Ornithinibacter sp.]